MMKRLLAFTRLLPAVGIAGIGLAGLVTPAAAVVINFDNLADNVVVTNQYPQATFSSDPGEVILTTAQSPPYLTSPPNFICTGSGGSIDCTHDVFVNFTNPVNNLTFLSTGADNVGPMQANVDVFVNGVFAGSVPIPGIGQLYTAQFIDLSAFHNVTSIEIDKVIDPSGLGYDDFTFNVANGVPELSTWAMMLIGFGGVGLLARRRDYALDDAA